jgi:hypothetical protein
MNKTIKQLTVWAEESIKNKKTLTEQKSYIKNKVATNKTILNDVIEFALEQLAYSYLYESRHLIKEKIINNSIKLCKKYPNESKISAALQLEAIRNPLLVSILDTYYCGEKPVGDCTKADIAKQIEIVSSQLKGYDMQLRILQKIYAISPATGILRKKVKPAQIIVILNDVKK